MTDIFEPVDAQFDFPKEEEKTLEFWTRIKAFETSVEMSKGKKLYCFYDGPPFATGLPHFGHILAGTIKDVMTRYAHQTGHHVTRRFGWDCHGLPVENEINKKLDIRSSDDVMRMGIREYNAECRSIVQRYAKEWEIAVHRMGRWVDMVDDYKTMEPWYMESIWWVFKTIYEKGLIYKGFRVMPYSTGLNTPLSNFEAGNAYQDVSDPAVVVSFPLERDPEVSLLAWTTTPWTLPSNLALCVHPELTYVQVRDLASGHRYVLGESALGELYPKLKKQGAKYKGGEFEVEQKFTGAEMKGWRYLPLFGYFRDHPNAFSVLNDTYVTADSGVGIVHQAPAFGEDDYRVCMEHGVITKGGALPCPVDDNGRFTSDVVEFAGRNVKECDNDICAKLKAEGRLVSKGTIVHSYPFCERSKTPLIYKAISSWFLRLDVIKEDLLRNNSETYWVPRAVKEKRFHNWLEGARDWNLSRNRYWGTPLPIWISEDEEEIVVVGSIQELEDLSGTRVTDLHRENVDDILIPSKMGKGMLRRVPEVFDCWFESGSMPYAQLHYPFENQDVFKNGFPADFIAEGLDQTRGWFYTLMVLSTALFNKPAFKNLIVNGLVLASDGKKMSKSLRNYTDPMELVEQYGADAIRLYMINSPAVRAEPLVFKDAGVLQVLKEVFLPWLNTFRFFVQNTHRVHQDEGWRFERERAVEISRGSENIMDRWIIAALHNLIRFVHVEMNAYRLYTVLPRLVNFISQLTNWYVRLNRSRLKGNMGLEDSKQGLSTLYVVLLDLTLIMSPFTPFFCEYLYQKLVSASDKSIHYNMLPDADESLIDEVIESKMNYMQEVITLGRLCRGTELPLKRPLRELIIVHESEQVLEGVRELESYIKLELNVKDVTYTTEEEKYCTLKAKADGKLLGAKLGKKFAAVNKAVQQMTHKELAACQKAGQIVVMDETLTLDEVQLAREVNVDESKYKAKVSTLNLTICLDTFVDETLLQEQLAREIMNRVQKLRRASGIELSDVVDIFFAIEQGEEAEMRTALTNNNELVVSTLRRPVAHISERRADAKLVGESTEEFSDYIVKLTLCWP